MDDREKDEERTAKRLTEETRLRSEVSALWPVIDRIRSVEIRFTGDADAEGSPGSATAAAAKRSLEARLATLEAEVAALTQIVRNGIGEAAVAEPAPPTPEEYPLHSWNGIVTAVAASVGLLLLAHWLIVVVYDLRTVNLLLSSIVIPLGVAIAFTRRRRIALRSEVAIALSIGLLAVFGMSYVTSVVERTSFLPENWREWRETLEYVASISFAYLTGVLASSAWQAHVGRGSGRVGETTLRVAQKLAKATGQALETGTKVGKQVKGIHDLINFSVPAATAVVSIVTGINGILK